MSPDGRWFVFTSRPGYGTDSGSGWVALKETRPGGWLTTTWATPLGPEPDPNPDLDPEPEPEPRPEYPDVPPF